MEENTPSLKKLELGLPAGSQVTESLLPPVAQTKKKFPLWLKITLSVLAVLLVFSGAIGVLAYQLVDPLRQTTTSANEAVASLQSQDLVTAEERLNETKIHLEATQSKYRLLAWTQFIPFVREYYLDGQSALAAGLLGVEAGDEMIKAIEPYSDLLGFKAKDGAQVEVQSAEDRIIFLVQTLDAIAPQLEGISSKLNLANDEIAKINPNHYPISFAGKNIRSKIIEVQDALKASAQVLSEAQPLIKLLPKLLGQDKEKTYMLLFQNDAEIRPTGGFMTAYAYLQVLNGKVTPLDSFDIYDLDARFTKRIPAPPAIKKYLNEDYYLLRNQNIDPDFRVSMDTFIGNYYQIPGVRKVDGIIAIDTQFPVMLLEILGPIGVGGWGNFTAEIDKRCDCPQVIYALEEIADRPVGTIRVGRKSVLGPLMHSVLANAMGSPKSKWPQILNASLDAIKQKHILFYFEDEDSQAAAEAFNASGRIKDFDGDYLHVNDANFGGAKSNMFTSQEVEQEIEMDSAGKVTKTVTLTYNNPFPGSNCNLEAGHLCLNGILREWIRLYVPQGSQLIEVIGSEVAGTAGEDLGKTVFEGFFTLRPQSTSKIIFKYELPGTYSSPLKLMIQKQPGKPSQKYTVNFNGHVQTFDLDTDTILTLQ
jgi:hypothetical protein